MTTLQELRSALSQLPEPPPATTAHIEAEIAGTVQYLASDAALRSLDADTYWPKWDSPWWHMLLLHELGEARRIPERVVRKMVDGLNALPLHIFPIRPEEVPAGLDSRLASSCHCAMGCIYQVLAACGVDVDREVPWAPPWFVRYQMEDGGLTCDSEAYLVKGECPSSMVGTVAPFEAMTTGTAWTAERARFLERAASFMVGRRLMLGSSSVHNAEERLREPQWLQPCFPRFYFYDVVRGLAALVAYARAAGASLPFSALTGVAAHLVAAFPDGIVRLGRRAHEGWGTLVRDDTGAWVRIPQASTFPLLDAVSVVGQPCVFSTTQWAQARRTLLELIDEGRVVA